MYACVITGEDSKPKIIGRCSSKEDAYFKILWYCNALDKFDYEGVEGYIVPYKPNSKLTYDRKGVPVGWEGRFVLWVNGDIAYTEKNRGKEQTRTLKH